MFIEALIDTGANCSLVKESIAKKIGCKLTPTILTLKGIGQNEVSISFTTMVTVQFDGLNLELDVYVARDCDLRYDLLIGRNAVQYPDVEIVTDAAGCRLIRKAGSSEAEVNSITTYNYLDELAIKTEHLNMEIKEQIFTIFKENLSVLDETSTVLTGELKLRLNKNDVVYYRPYRLAPIEKEKVDKIIQELLEKGIIRESESPFASPVILVKKKDGCDRMCVDFRALNRMLEKDRYPLPLIEDQLDKLGKARFFISLDMKNGFHQIPIANESIKYTAFVTPGGHYEFLKMPFGICNGPAVFQRAITKAIEHLKFLLVYIDDILIPCCTIDEGLNYLERTIRALSTTGFTINLNKCKFFVEEIEYLGRHISHEGIRPSEAKVSALMNSPVPKNIKQVRQFMGLASYFRKFIPNFAVRTACITKLTGQNQKWEWGPEQVAARDYVIQHLSSKPLLTVFDPNLVTELYTDASSLGYGAILVQIADNTKKVVAYYSKRTTTAESNYHSYELETLAVFNALKEFRVYLLGIKFTIITDCNSIKSTMSKKDLSPRVARWWVLMQDFNFDITYKKGKFISHVDFLSRNPVNILVSDTLPSESSESKTTESVPNNHTINNLANLLIDEPQSWLQTAQQNDIETQNIITQVLAADIDVNRYVLRNELLYYQTQPNNLKLYVPRISRFQLLKLYHDDNCHVGIHKTIEKLQEHFWFPRMSFFVKKYISHCRICIERKGHSGPKQGFLNPIEKIPVPFHTVHVDCTGPFSQTSEGYKYILLLVDGFTKFCFLKPLKTLGAQELVPLIREIITLFGTPSRVITDRGTNFSSQQIGTLFRELQIEHHMVATGTPRGNGQVERYVATVIDMLNTSCNGLSDWPSELWKVQLSINTTIQKSTGFTPIHLLTGLNGNIPSIQACLNGINSIEPDSNLNADRELAYSRLNLEANKFKVRFDNVRRDNKSYEIGTLVYVNQDHRRHNKLSARFKGPYEIIEVLPHDRFNLRGLGNLRNIIVAKDKLRCWPGEWVVDEGDSELSNDINST